MSIHDAIAATQVNSRGHSGTSSADAKRKAAARARRAGRDDHHNAMHPLKRGAITLESLLDRYECVYIERAWTPKAEGYLVWLGDPPQAGEVCDGLQSALAEAVIACGDPVSDGRSKRRT